jgi:hypothetical protein
MPVTDHTRTPTDAPPAPPAKSGRRAAQQAVKRAGAQMRRDYPHLARQAEAD